MSVKTYPCLHRKEVIQPHLPIRLPCYDLTPIIEPTLDGCLLAVSPPALGVFNFHGLTGGVYKARERIHRNKKLGKVVEFIYDEKMLPHFIEWKSMVAGDYALGIEPSTTTLDADFVKTPIKEGENHIFQIDIDVKNL